MKRSMTTVSLPGPERLSGAGKARKLFQNNWRLYALLLPALIWLVIFCYVPMYGVLIAFKDYSPKLGILHSHWADPCISTCAVLSTSVASRTISNTIILSLYSIARVSRAHPVRVLLNSSTESG
jgi:putative aldouronate transport system permease protein